MGIAPKTQTDEQPKAAECNRQKAQDEKPTGNENDKKSWTAIFDIETAETKIVFMCIGFFLFFLYVSTREQQTKQDYQNEALEKWRQREKASIDEKPV